MFRAEPAQAAELLDPFKRLGKCVGIRGTALKLIPSSSGFHSAAVVGWLPGMRQLWIGEWLVGNLTRQQIEMVLLHEFGHIRRKHFLHRLLPLVFAGFVVAPVLLQLSVPLTVALVALALFVLIAGIRLAAHRCEYDADRFACEVARKHCTWADNSEPAEVMSTALERLVDSSSVDNDTWLHPSVSARIRKVSGSHNR